MAGRCASSAKSHAGAQRRLNEDAYLARPDLGLWAVADGMGGHRAGDVASQRVVRALDFAAPATSPRALLADVHAALDETNAALDGIAAGYGGDAVVASTVVGLIVADLRFACFWVGDSRAYMVRASEIRQLTRDDSHVQDLVDAGEVAADEAEGHPLAHVVTAAVGGGTPLNLHVRHGRLADGDRFVLCSDGLSRCLSARAIARLTATTPLAGAAAALVDQAVAAGATDNVTAVVVGRLAADAADSGEPDTVPGARRGRDEGASA
jgi:protein phosphatase/serine/threonine-protein phosphatase Stp1